MRSAREFLALSMLPAVLGGCALTGVLREPAPIDPLQLHTEATEAAMRQHQAGMEVHDAAVRLHEQMAQPPAPVPEPDLAPEA
jgi:hypothetical protein